MSETPYCDRSLSLSLSRTQEWTLHDVLLDRIKQAATAAAPSETTPPPVEIFLAFETLEAGGTSFTVAQLEAIQAILAEYHHTPTWEFDRAEIEQLLRCVTDQLDQDYPALPSE